MGDTGLLFSLLHQGPIYVKTFTESLDGKKHAAEIERDKKLALDMDLYNTPTFFINGRKVIGERPFEYFKIIIDEELKHAKQ